MHKTKGVSSVQTHNQGNIEGRDWHIGDHNQRICKALAPGAHTTPQIIWQEFFSIRLPNQEAEGDDTDSWTGIQTKTGAPSTQPNAAAYPILTTRHNQMQLHTPLQRGVITNYKDHVRIEML
jgi:hypothetical protein